MHAAYVPAPAGVSNLHSNVAFGSELNVNDGAVALMVPVGPAVIVVSGAVVSTVNVLDAGADSTLVARSVARTRNVYVPSASGPRFRGEAQVW